MAALQCKLLISHVICGGDAGCRLQVIDRILYKLDELVRPFVHKILVVIEPLLIDEDYYARVEGASAAPPMYP